MSLTDEDYDFLTRVLREYGENRGKVSQWEQGFMDDQEKRWDEHGSSMSLSAKQWAIIRRVADKLGIKE